jgi:hypothetical protein
MSKYHIFVSRVVALDNPIFFVQLLVTVTLMGICLSGQSFELMIGGRLILQTIHSRRMHPHRIVNLLQILADKGVEVNSPDKRNSQLKRKGGQQQQVYRPIQKALLPITDGGEVENNGASDAAKVTCQVEGVSETDHLADEEPLKKRPTPTNSGNKAEAAQ